MEKKNNSNNHRTLEIRKNHRDKDVSESRTQLLERRIKYINSNNTLTYVSAHFLTIFSDEHPIFTRVDASLGLQVKFQPSQINMP